MSESNWFYYAQNEKAFGPFRVEQMIEHAEMGVMKADALVCRAGEETWSNVGNHAFLSAQLSAPIAVFHRKEQLRATLDTLLIGNPKHRDVLIDRLGRVKVFYRSNGEHHKGAISLWQVLDMIDAGVLPIDTQVCVDGSDYWRDALMVCANAVCAA